MCTPPSVQNAELKAKSRNSLLQTKRRYERLAETMRGAEARLEPVLAQVRDYVLYLKHHLNAQAIGALNKEADSIEIEVGSLIEEMNASIREADDGQAVRHRLHRDAAHGLLACTDQQAMT